ncbi:MAG: preprotein translocase subunit SecD [Firmicutes bacterium]|nr:preprotein translocase subunit SecD [Bacillota bacterium]
MRWGNLAKFLIPVVVILGIFGFYVSPLAYSIKQGLDLQGGTHVVMEAVDTPEAKVDNEAMQRAVQIMERRVNGLGLTEPLIQRQGDRRIIIELPGIKDPEGAIAIIGKTALLEFKDEAGNTVMNGNDLTDAKESYDQNHQAVVGITFSSEGATKFADLTAKNVGKRIAIVLDNQILTNPTVQEAIPSGKAQITGNRSLEEAHNLAILLKSGSLPVKLNIVETRTVGPTLGQDSKEKSEVAFAISIVAILVFMLLFYRLSGLVANIALVLFVLLLLFCLKMLNATLTLPGIAGIILTMGMAVDANVLIFERFKEEYRNGKTLRAAMDAGFSRAFNTIFDSNITTLFAAVVLFFFGSGTLKGFAINLGLGIILSMFTAITATRYLLKALMNTNIFKNGKFFGA